MPQDKQENSGRTSELERTHKLLDQIGGERGPLGPVVKQLKGLIEKDPVLRQAIETLPSDNSKKH